MADGNESVRATLDRLTAQARADHSKWPELRGYMREVLHCANPRPEARDWLEARIAEFAKEDLVKVVRMAYEDPDPENKRAASMVILRNADKMPDHRVRADHLKAVSENTRLHADARAEAVRLLRLDRVRGDTLTGMPAVRAGDLKGFGRAARGVPPSPQDIHGKITLKGPVR